MDDLRRIIRRIIEAGPARFESHAARARMVKSVVAAEIAARLEPALNAEADSMPQNTLDEKRALASWVNYELRRLGLAIRCEPSGLPGILVAMPGRGDREESSRFRVEARDAEGRKVQSSSIGWVPRIRLVEDPVRREGRSRFRE